MKSHRFFFFAALSFLASCQGCFGCKTSPIDDENLQLVRSCQSAPPLIEPPKLDILFVIDNSNSMREEQEGVARELTAFIDELKKGGGVPAEFNIGVITTSVYLNGRVGNQSFLLNYATQSGRLRAIPTALADGGTNYDDPAAERLLSGTDPELINKFSRLVQQGVTGSGQETPFEAVRLALLSDLINAPISQGGNGGFLRDGARLLVVVLTDEDDCSEKARPPVVSVGDNGAVADCTQREMELTPVGEYHRMFTEELKNSDGTAREVIWTAIAPVGITNKNAMATVSGGQVRNDDCPTSNQAGFRQRQMAEMFDNTLINLDSICKATYRDTLITIAQLASVSQSIEIKNVADEKLMQFIIKRKDGSTESCTTQNGGITNVSRNSANTAVKFQFGNQCRRRADDQSIEVKMICVT